MALPRVDNRYQMVPPGPGARAFVAKQSAEKFVIELDTSDVAAKSPNPPTTPSAVAITSISTADPALVTAVGHGVIVGDIVTIEGNDAVDANGVSVDGTYMVITKPSDDTFTIGFNNSGGTVGTALGTSTKVQLYTGGVSRIYKSATGTPGTWHTATPHGLAAGDVIVISNTTGTPAVTVATPYTVASTPTPTTFTCTSLDITVAHKIGWLNRGMTEQGSDAPYLVPLLNTHLLARFSLVGGAATASDWNNAETNYPAGTGAIPLYLVRYKANGTSNEIKKVVLVVQLDNISAVPAAADTTEDRIIPVGALGTIKKLVFDPNEVKDISFDAAPWLGSRLTSASAAISDATPDVDGAGGTAPDPPAQLTNTSSRARYLFTAPASAGWSGLIRVDMVTNPGGIYEEIKRMQVQVTIANTA